MGYTIIFGDGLTIENAKIDAGILASPTEISRERLTEKALETVRILPMDGGEARELRYAKTDTVYRVGDEWHFCLAGASPEQVRLRELEGALAALRSGQGQ